MAAKNLSVFFFLSFFAISSASEGIPVLIWASSQLEQTLPSALAGHSLNSKEFHDNYLHKFVPENEKLSNVVVFIQDKLGLEDFTQYADVFSGLSSGGIFKNIKHYMETKPSTTLSSVKEPLSALDMLKKSFENIHEYDPKTTLKNLKKNGNNLIIVNLPDTRKDGAFSVDQQTKNDHQIFKVLSELASNSFEYAAIFTAKESSRVKRESTSSKSGRHLLALDDNGVFINGSSFNGSSCVFMYYESMQLTAYGKTKSDIAVGNLSEPDSSKVDNCSSTSITLDMEWSNIGSFSSVKMSIKFVKDRWDWKTVEWEVSYTGEINSTKAKVSETVYLKANEVYGPVGYSYSCSPATTWAANKTSLVAVKFQVQAFNIVNGVFGYANNCISFFTPAIWSGLIVAFLLIAILFYGVCMIANIKTMDRFDDPKGKTIQVNVSE